MKEQKHKKFNRTLEKQWVRETYVVQWDDCGQKFRVGFS